MEERIYQDNPQEYSQGEFQSEYPEHYTGGEMPSPEYSETPLFSYERQNNEPYDTNYIDTPQNIPEQIPEYMPEEPYPTSPNITSQQEYFNSPHNAYAPPMTHHAASHRPSTPQDYMDDYHNLHKTNTAKKAFNEKIKMNNEKFVMIALLASVVLTSIIIGIGWSLFSPNPKKFTVDTKNIASDTNTIGTTDDLVIVYGTKSNENQMTRTNIQTPTKTPLTPSVRKSTPITPKKPVAVSAEPLSTRNIDKTIKKSPTVATKTLYWIQVFATTNKDRALQIKNDFANQGITPSIVTKTINNTVYYRLRIGPYFNKAESNKFLQWVKAKDNASYQDAYISTIKK